MKLSTISAFFLLGAALVQPQFAQTTTGTQGQPAGKYYPSTGEIERLDPRIDKLLVPLMNIKKLARGFEWAEGPVWSKRGDYLLFSDIPNNVVFKWDPERGTSVWLNESGYTSDRLRGGEMGSNGLTFNEDGRLILCQHGNRQVALLEPDGTFTPVARYHKLRRFNSPNDLVFKSNGDLYFTDPPYGLEKGNDDPAKELAFNGVYRVTPEGKVTLLISDLSYPNGIAFSPTEQTLYIAVSDPKNPVIMAYNVEDDGTLSHGGVFFDASHLAEKDKGLPDGLKVDQDGNLWATGPGGVLVISPEGTHLGTIRTGRLTANCAFGGDDGSTLYITADDHLLRVDTLTRGAAF